jgi:DNA-binding response OmpR family regulator
VGFALDFAASSQAARAAVKDKKFDVILVDFDLGPGPSADTPRESGITLIRELRNANISTPIVMYTSMMGEFYEMSALDAGADDHISKMTPIPRLVTRLQNHIKRGSRNIETQRAISHGNGAQETKQSAKSRASVLDEASIQGRPSTQSSGTHKQDHE